MFKSDFCQLTTKDYYTLQSMLDDMFLQDELMRSILREKLSNAIVTFPEDIPSTIATLNSRISFRVDNGLLESRTIASNAMRGVVGMTVISISNPRGLGLLGLAEGQSAIIGKSPGVQETVMVEKVIYQPEAEERRIDERREMIEENERMDSRLFRFKKPASHIKDPVNARNDNDGDDEPDPSAA
ncbi:nucleoside-diphosphate kinase [Phyllobacterium sp. SB3]|uniref:nucleoside-diphosphate kinase n=1 Tax=Phyllobacterium sp. SB3 TaxID=3156073 RepID=UPI0032AF3DFC